ncbi:MAG TPA: DUF3859 domain-containing protein [Gammaproteobacteria bacterium]|nr:DUF3859 domain-containing protein [Gammaproteobacteria bacterium]
MKYIVPLAVILMLSGCAKNSSESADNKNTTISPGYLDAPLQGKISRSGIYRMVRSGGIVNDSKTGTGKAVAHPVVQFVRSTQRIPLIKGAQMYMQYRLWYFPDKLAYADLRRVLKHPKMTLPDGSTSTGSDFMIKRRVASNQVISYTGYGFDEDYELVEGEWTFELWYEGEKLAEQKFTTYKPDEEEIAELVPLLKLGNNVLTEMKVSEKGFSRKEWSHVVVKNNNTESIPDLSELKQALNDPYKKDIP